MNPEVKFKHNTKKEKKKPVTKRQVLSSSLFMINGNK